MEPYLIDSLRGLLPIYSRTTQQNKKLKKKPALTKKNLTRDKIFNNNKDG